MEIITDLSTWQNLRKQLAPELSIGAVMTMGNLHDGHASLIQKSKNENDKTILTIYVNPTQFNDANDLKNYPHTVEQDLLLAKDYSIDYVLMPTDAEMYQDHFNFQMTTTHPLSQIMEGAFRPNHFNGMLTIVMKLLLLTKPHRAYFGEKDYQQLELVKDLVKTFFLETSIVSCTTLREPSGLALSSRNNRLSDQERSHASLLYRLLSQHFPKEKIIAHLEKEGFKVDYVEAYENRLLAAVHLGNIRLIDNVCLNLDSAVEPAAESRLNDRNF